MKNISMLVFIALGIAVSLSACTSAEAEPQTITKKSAPPVLEVVRVQEERPVYQLQMPAELRPYETVMLHAKIRAFVKKIYVDRGSLVRKGQLLALLEAPELSQQSMAAKAQVQRYEQEYRYAQQAFTRLKQASLTGGAVAALELERAETALQAAEAAWKSAQAQSAVPAEMQSYLRILAPFDGQVVSREVSEGALVGENNVALFSLAQNRKLRLTLELPEKHAQSIDQDTELSFQVSSIPGKVFKARLARSAKLIQAQGRALTLEFDVDNAQGHLNGGEFAQVSIALQRAGKTLWLPTSSIIRSQSGIFVWRVGANEQLEKVALQEGAQWAQLQEVFGDLKAGDRILKKASEEHSEGDTVKLKDAE